MSISSAVMRRLDEFLQELLAKDGRFLVFFKGFRGEFYQELQNRPILGLNEDKWLNKKGYINAKLLSENSRELMLKYLTSNNKIIWGYYEEFIELTGLLNNIKKQFDGEIYIISNNLFEKYYFLDLDDEINSPLLEYFSKEELQVPDAVEPYINYYSNAIEYTEGRIGISYINRHLDEGIKEIDFYEHIKVEYSEPDPEYRIIPAKDASFEIFKDDLQKGKNHGKIQLLIQTDCDMRSVTPVLSLCRYAKVPIKLCMHDKFSELSKDDGNEYLHILKQYWGTNSKFRILKFYKNPDVDNELTDISQGHIISEIIKQSEKAINGKNNYSDIFITAPTGAGKSLLFQVPAIHLAEKWKAVTIVITPLIALMRDQVALLEEKGIECATFINSEITFDEKERRISKIKDGKFSIVYLSPEFLLANHIENIIGDRKIGLMVVDEAHLVTTWGRDFRADYWFLGDYIERIRKFSQQVFPILCLTATAVYMGGEDVVNDTVSSLNLRNHKLYLGNVRRENISFKINYLPKHCINGSIDDFKTQKTSKRIEEFVDGNIKSIVYCPYTTHVEDIYSSLNTKYQNIVGRYYGSFDKYEKLESYEKFKYGDYTSIICTKAFGMGVDVSDIELVYHYAPTGNLADYVQEIGRAARKEYINGVAMTDFTDKDLKYVRMLHGLSGMRQYQLKEIMRKLYQIYKEKNSRNFLVSPEAFSYLFNEHEIENKVKSGLLLISKDLDLKYGFPVINVRPRSLFTKNFINVPHSIKQDFLNKFGKYAKKIQNTGRRKIPTYGKSSDIVVYNTGDIYEMEMDKLWEKNFNHLTFAEFKWQFFEGRLFSFENGEKISPRINVIIHYNDDFDSVSKKLEEYIIQLMRIFEGFKRKGRVFNKIEFREAFKKEFKGFFGSSEIPNVLLDIFVADVHQNIGFNKNINRLEFIQERRAHNRDELVYRVMNSNYTILKNHVSRLLAQCVPNINRATFDTYVAISKNRNQNSIIYLAILLELFGLASYEIIGGKNTEIFIRVNDPAKIRRLLQTNYSNNILKDIERKRNRSQKVITQFMKKNMSDEQRWNIIEKYFLGRDEEISAFLGIE